jgi:hypothetical protein
MDRAFFCVQQPAVEAQGVCLDMKGFVDVSSALYRAIINAEPESQDDLSEPEFLLCCAQVLTNRLLQVRTSITTAVMVGQADLHDALSRDISLPTPLTTYMEGLGAVKDTYGQTLYPEMVLPETAALDDEHETGFAPVPPTNDYGADPDYAYITSMIPFGIYRRAIEEAHGHEKDTGGAYAIHPEARDEKGNTIFSPELTKTHYMRPRSHNFHPMAQLRQGRLTTRFKLVDGILGAISWNSQLFNQFLHFLERVSPYISMTKIPQTFTGSPAMLAFAVPQNATKDEFPNEFYYYSSYKLTTAEQHAARLFRYRELRLDPDGCYLDTNRDGHVAFRCSPASTQDGTLIIAQVPDYNAYLTHFIRHYMKPM